MLNIPQNIMQLIEISVDKLVNMCGQHQHKLIVIGKELCPINLDSGNTIQRRDWNTDHEEADVSVASQALHGVSVKSKTVRVMADDSDIPSSVESLLGPISDSSNDDASNENV